MNIGDNVRIKAHKLYAPGLKPYIGQVGAIIDENIVRTSKRYKVQFSDGFIAWYFEPELETGDQAQRQRCVEDCLTNDDPNKQQLLKAALVVYL